MNLILPKKIPDYRTTTFSLKTFPPVVPAKKQIPVGVFSGTTKPWLEEVNNVLLTNK
jgi:hypothetical protein